MLNPLLRMSLSRASLVTLALLWAGSALAATAPEQVRAELTSARAALQQVSAQTGQVQAELDALTGQIATLKAQKKSTLLPGNPLEASLRRSQELADTLHGLGTAKAAAEDRVARATSQLFGALGAEVERARDEVVSAPDRATRQRALERFKAVRSERETLRASLPGAQLPPHVQDVSSDDPQELFEQADALRDSEDKVRHRVKELQGRIFELKSERELDRRMGDFLGDESLFDEQDRRLRVQRDSTGLVRASPTSTPNPGVNADFSLSPPNAPAPAFPADSSGPSGAGPEMGPTIVTPPPASVVATDGRPQVGSPRALSRLGMDDLPALEREQKALELEARSLSDRAHALEERAKHLE